ncbi:3'-5' exonuclease [Pseudarthrobacter sp. R1]|uniref:3'-5' exonuclease n=1 Tax=Pseudarthrobacter sp. R1 TaxID=2944934 RepID=UPI00210A9CB9|nr:3'-5' exonuclease [Pseudarthrobacter sp. R1]MCQ6272771.1 3'-5' exonuclease [Pseudarthrobacter sp. R1]
MAMPLRSRIRDARAWRESQAREWTEFNYCVIDIETTGLDPGKDSIISFGAVPIIEGRISVPHGTSFLIRPECAVGIESAKIHMLRDQDLREMPRIGSYAPAIAAAVEGRIVVAHSAWMEQNFLTHALGRRELPFRLPIIDTARMAEKALDLPPLGRADVSLEYLSQSLGLPTHTPHDALSDALTTAQVFLVLAHKLAAQQPLVLRELLSLSQSTSTGVHYGWR